MNYVLQLAAAVAHEVNCALQAAFQESVQPRWDELSEDLRENAFNSVARIMANPDITPQGLHAEWVEHKKSQGWVYGPVKDKDAKTHPCIAPYETLSHEDRAKDYAFIAVVRAVAKLAVDIKGHGKLTPTVSDPG